MLCEFRIDFLNFNLTSLLLPVEPEDIINKSKSDSIIFLFTPFFDNGIIFLKFLKWQKDKLKLEKVFLSKFF